VLPGPTDDNTTAAHVDLPAASAAPPHRTPHELHVARRGDGPNAAGTGAVRHGASAGSDHLKRSMLAEGQLLVYAFDTPNPSDLVALSYAPVARMASEHAAGALAQSATRRRRALLCATGALGVISLTLGTLLVAFADWRWSHSSGIAGTGASGCGGGTQRAQNAVFARVNV
jgi:hypothetical protein